MSKEKIGIVGIHGDLGAQLARRYTQRNIPVQGLDRNAKHDTKEQFVRECSIIHVCAPLEALDTLPPTDACLVLHDSVMHSSIHAANTHEGTLVIVHMLMNQQDTVVVARDMPGYRHIANHLAQLDLRPQYMSIVEHDYLMARSQAPLALLCRTLLPYLHEQAELGLLTPSGQLLADTLRARELVWTDATIRSILRNPQLKTLLREMSDTLQRYQSTK